MDKRGRFKKRVKRVNENAEKWRASTHGKSWFSSLSRKDVPKEVKDAKLRRAVELI